MARGPKKHLKALNAPKHWLLAKLAGTWAPRPSAGPHKLRECVPLMILIRNRLKYALTHSECKKVLMQRLVKIDGKVRTDQTFPCGFMDVITIERTGENFRLLYDTKGRFVLHRLDNKSKTNEAAWKLCRVKAKRIGDKAIPNITTHDGRTIRYPDPNIAVNDTVKVDLSTGKIIEHCKFEVGSPCMVTGGHNVGRVGVLAHREKHPGSFEIVHIKDALGHTFATRIANVFAIGRKGEDPIISLPRGKGIKLDIVAERDRRSKAAAKRR
jgi:small subunit ribosomal protein S4e